MKSIHKNLFCAFQFDTNLHVCVCLCLFVRQIGHDETHMSERVFEDVHDKDSHLHRSRFAIFSPIAQHDGVIKITFYFFRIPLGWRLHVLEKFSEKLTQIPRIFQENIVISSCMSDLMTLLRERKTASGTAKRRMWAKISYFGYIKWVWEREENYDGFLTRLFDVAGRSRYFVIHADSSLIVLRSSFLSGSMGAQIDGSAFSVMVISWKGTAVRIELWMHPNLKYESNRHHFSFSVVR
jgi:hypothetical protein